VDVCDKKHADKSPLFSFFSAVSIIVSLVFVVLNAFLVTREKHAGLQRSTLALFSRSSRSLASLPGIHKRTHGQGRTLLVRNVELSCNSTLHVASCFGAIRLEYANRQITLV
jgi:hypothetical protein